MGKLKAGDIQLKPPLYQTEMRLGNAGYQRLKYKQDRFGLNDSSRYLKNL